MRQANIEILRGLLMFFVVGCHVLNIGANTCPPLLTSGLNYYFTTFFDSFFMLAVDCFVIISGYFGIKLKAKKIVSLLLPVYFYSIIIGGIAHLTGFGSLSLSHFLPICFNSYWFLTSYLLLCLFSPFLNSYVEKCSILSFSKILCVLYILFAIVPSFSFFSLTHDDGFGVINFILMYLTGCFLAKVKRFLPQSWKIFYFLHILFVIIIFSENVMFNVIFRYNRGYQGLFWHYDNIFVILGSVTLLLTFLNLKFENEKFTKFVCWLSPSFFYIYIIHCTSPLGGALFSSVDDCWFLNSSYFPIYVISLALLIFTFCLLLDILFRRFAFKWLFDIVHNSIMQMYNKVNCLIVSKFNI